MLTNAKSAQVDQFVHTRLPATSQLPDFVFTALAAPIPERINLVQALFAKAYANGHGDRPFLRSDILTLSYAQTEERVNRIANLLIQEHGLEPGNRVLLRGSNSIGMALAWLAVVKAGLIAVATMPLLRARELATIIEKSKPALAICQAQLIEELQLANLPMPVLQFGLMENGQPAPTDLGSLSAAKPSQFLACETLGTDIALMAFTSGTTGAPKAAIHTHRDVLAACEAWPAHVLMPVATDIVVGTPPLAFTFGLGGMLLFPMWAGACVYYPSAPYTPKLLAETVEKLGATTCYTAPTFYRQMAAFLSTENCKTLKHCVSAGEALPLATRKLFKQACGIDLLDGIGATEMFHIFVSSRASDTAEGAIGKVVPGYEARVVDDEGNELPRGQVGKLAVRGVTGCKYLGDARQANYVKNGWNYPGDAFLQDEAGNFFYQSRTDDMIITAGYNVGAAEVEDVLLLHPAVAECGVVGQEDDERGMIIHAFVLLKPGHTAGEETTKALQDHVKLTAAPYKYPRKITFVSSMPRTETGKLQRFKLREQQL